MLSNEKSSSKTIAGKKLDAEVTLNKVQKIILPNIDDEFAKTLGKFDSVAELKKNIAEGLTVEKNNKEKERIRKLLQKEEYSWHCYSCQ